MTIYVVGNEVGDFEEETGTSLSIYTNAGQLRWEAAYSRMAIYGTNIYKAKLTFGASLSEFWFHAQAYIDGTSTATGLIFRDSSSGHEVIRVLATAAGGAFKVTYRNSGVQTDLVTFTALLDAALPLDIHIKTHATAGRVAIYQSNVLKAEYTGPLVPDTTTMDEVVLGTFYSNNTLYGTYWSQVVVSNESTLRTKVQTLYPTADGTITNWTGAYTDVDELTLLGTDYLTTDTANATALFDKNDIASTLADRDIKAVSVSSRSAIDSGSTVTDNQHIVNVSSTTYASASLGITNDGSEVPRQTIWNTNPNTTAAWTESEVNAMTFGMKAVT